MYPTLDHPLGWNSKSKNNLLQSKTVNPSWNMSYEDSKYKGREIRKSSNIYNQSLVASLIKNNGEKKTAAWAKGMVNNFMKPINDEHRY